MLLSFQSCPTLCDPIDGSPPGSPVPGILQARTLEWVAISFSNAGRWKVKMKSLSRAQPSATPSTAAFQAPPSMGFSRQEYWSGVPLPSLRMNMRNFNLIIAHLKAGRMRRTFTTHWYRGQGPSEEISTLSDCYVQSLSPQNWENKTSTAMQKHEGGFIASSS